MPLVQSLDLLRRRVTIAGVQPRARRRPREGAIGHRAVGRVRRRTASCFPASTPRRCWRASAAATSTRCCAATSSTRRSSRRVKRKTVSALVYPAILISLALVAGDDHRAEGGAGVRRISTARSAPSCRCARASSSRISDVPPRAVPAGDRRRSSAPSSRSCRWVRRPGQQARFDRLLLGLPMLGHVARKFATSQMARTLATLLGGGLPLVNALDIAAKSVGNQYMAGQLDIVSARVREGESFAAALEARQAFPGRRGQDGGGRRVDRRAAGNAEHRRRLLRRGDRDDHGPLRHAGRAGAAGRHGHRDRRAAAGALHAAVPAQFGAGTDSTDGRRHRTTDPAAGADRPRRRVSDVDQRRGARAGAAARRALPPRVHRHGHVPDRPGPVPIDPGGSDAALRLRAVPPRRARRWRSSSPTRPTCR